MSLQNQVDILASSMKNCNQLIEQVNQTYKCNFKDKYENETYDDIKLNVYCELCRNAGYNACTPNEQHHHGGCYNTGVCQTCGGDGKVNSEGGGKMIFNVLNVSVNVLDAMVPVNVKNAVVMIVARNVTVHVIVYIVHTVVTKWVLVNVITVVVMVIYKMAMKVKQLMA